jgi:Cof subfamily protein (haloacid dehalogenase superfamily)
MTNHYKLLVIDIDGTLIDRLGGIPAENSEALALARRAGLKVAISTGRSIVSSRRFIEELSLDCAHIFFDGALVSRHDRDDEVYAQPIDPAVLQRMIEFAHRHDTDLELYSAKGYFCERETWSTRAHRRFFGAEPIIGELTGLTGNERIVKGALVVTSDEEKAKADRFSEHFSDSICFSYVTTPAFPDITFINLLAPDTSKGRALEILSAHIGVSLSEVVAVGDGQNDISLLTTAGLGIAMGNADDELKEVADRITLDVDEHGLAAAIREILL